MLTKKEISTLNLSPTKKDFVQVWNELLEVAGKLSERWDPTSTNESDPGIVILKVLASIADKLNYNIDKNILEAFMPTAAQEDSMRKLCEMLGYNMKYYQSAQTTATIRYHNSEPSTNEKEIMVDGDGVLIPRFTVLTNNDQDIYYFTVNKEPCYISDADSVKTLPCMEGQIIRCEGINDNYVITINQISDRNRFYLPEIQIAENGIFINNIAEIQGTLGDGATWERVDNLNTQTRGSRVFKFGYDSYEGRPYIEFPEDYSELFGEGIFIYYARTSGVNGNISRGVLTQMELPSGDDWGNLSADSFSVINHFAATSGSDIETIAQAYNSFKKTVGTFDTLVTCRDYMNKIYSLVSEEFNRPYVSNVLVTDIRSDINKANIICSCDGAGIFYKETPIFLNEVVHEDPTFTRDVLTEAVETEKALKPYKPVFKDGRDDTDPGCWWLATDDGHLLFPLDADYLISSEDNNEAKFDINKNGTVYINATEAGGTITESYWYIEQDNNNFRTVLPAKTLTSTQTTIEYKSTQEVVKKQLINNFDLVLYPFKTYTQIKNNVTDSTTPYDNSFTYSNTNSEIIKEALRADDLNTISHNIIDPQRGDVVCINNYLRLDITIATRNKITVEEGSDISDKIRIALANAFNMRELDFGEEIPFDSIISVIEGADSRIKVAALGDPAVYTTFSVLEEISNKSSKVVEYAVASKEFTESDAKDTGRFDMSKDVDGKFIGTFDSEKAKKIFNKLAVRNILAGRIPLFKYNKSFKTSFSEGTYQVVTELKSSDYVSVNLPRPTKDNPYTVMEEENKIYTGQWIDEKNTKYKCIETPDKYKNNVISEVNNNGITDIETICEIPTTNGLVENVTLENNEFIKFRAPNFITKKTYPAYVNYHLDLREDLLSPAVPAEAESLFSILNSDINSWSENNQEIKWQKVLNYFGKLTDESGSSYVKTYELKQKISKHDPESTTPPKAGSIELGISNNNAEKPEYTLEELLMKSGCLKLTSPKAKVFWDPDDESAPNEPPNIEITLKDKEDKALNPFITSVDVVSAIQSTVDDYLNVYYTSDEFPKTHSWYISFEFVCVPFEAKSLAAWESFVKSTEIRNQLLDFEPISENGNILWRIFGEGYDIGKYVTSNTKKLLSFTSNYFDLLPNPYLDGIYLVKDLGKTPEPFTITNNSEYQLKDGEYLYLEYTPSETADDGTSQSQPAVTEIYEKGTIIRPSGFDVGIKDSVAYRNLGNSPYKTVTFALSNKTTQDLEMFRFGANEQVEIRDYDQVILDKTTFTKSANKSAIYVYKNFNCDELERYTIDDNGNRINNVYTLKDNECIFYTDSAQTDYAVYSSGTRVELEGTVVLDQYDIIDISTILDLGIQEIPWSILDLKTDSDKLIFTAYQYITLGAKDKLVKLKLMSDDSNKLSSVWQSCYGNSVEYWPGGDASSKANLPEITVGKDDWEVCSVCELNVSPSSPQKLRNDGTIATGLKLSAPSSSGGEDNDDYLEIVPDKGIPLSFKTNLACQATDGKINIKDVYINPKKFASFELKVFASKEPVIVKTAAGKVTPHDINIDFADYIWSGSAIEIKKDALWSKVDLEEIKVNKLNTQNYTTYDCALRLSPSVLPDTYGIFCVYLDYANTFKTIDDFKDIKTWIEVIPGTSCNDIRAINKATNSNWEISEVGSNEPNKFLLHQGINCIRINKSTKLFIKTSEGSQGTLYFDDLQLVDCTKASIVNTEAETITQIDTNGLNLDQIGYLPIDTPNSLRDAYLKGRMELVESANSNISDINSDISEQITSWQKIFKNYKTEVDFLVSKEDAILKELASLDKAIKSGATTKNVLKGLYDQYEILVTNLSCKKALKNAIEENKNLSSLRQSLTEMLEGFTSAEVFKQQLIENLEKIKEQISVNENISDEAVLEDYYSFVDNTTYIAEGSGFPTINESESDYTKEIHEKATAEIVKAHTAKMDSDYLNSLTELSDKLDSITNLEARNSILTLLNNIKMRQNAPFRKKLLALVSELSKQADISIIEGLLSDMMSSAAAKDYVNLASRATTLLNSIQTDDLNILIAEIAAAAEDSQDNTLLDLLNRVEKILKNPNGTIGSVLKDIIDKISNIIVEAQAFIDNPEYDPTSDLSDQVSTVRDKIINNHYRELIDLVGDIKAAVNSIINNKDFDEIITKLQSYSDTNYVDSDKITETIKALAFQRNNSVEGLRVAAIHEVLIKLFPKEAILEVWPKYMLERFNRGVTELNKTLKTAIENLDDFSDNLDGSRKVDSVIQDINDISHRNQFTDVLGEFLGKDLILDFIAYFGRLENKLREQVAREEFINNLSSQVTPSSNLITALNGLSTTNNNRELSLYNLVVSFKNVKDVKRQTELLDELKLELAQAITSDELLITAISSYFYCPTLFYPDPYLDDSGKEGFYTELNKRINNIRSSFRSWLDDPRDTSGLKWHLTREFASDSLFKELLSVEGYTQFTSKLKDFLDKVYYPGALSAILRNDVQLSKRLVDIDEYFTFMGAISDLDRLVCWLNTIEQLSSYIEKFKNYTIDESITDKDLANISYLLKYRFEFETDPTNPGSEIESIDSNDEIKNELIDICKQLFTKFADLDELRRLSIDRWTPEMTTAIEVLVREEQLLAEILLMDLNNDFYYNAPIDPALAIDFSTNDDDLRSSLLNPSVNYDINNVNNNFVISKLDMDYLKSSIKLARSSRLN